MNEAAEVLRIADMRVLPSSVSIAGHPSGTRPIGKIAQAVEIQRLRLQFRIAQPTNRINPIAPARTG
jgi:hypothetical protein